MQLRVELRALPDKLSSEALPVLARDKIDERGSNFVSKELGIELRDLTPDIAQRLSLGDNSGVIVPRSSRRELPPRRAFAKG